MSVVTNVSSNQSLQNECRQNKCLQNQCLQNQCRNTKLPLGEARSSSWALKTLILGGDVEKNTSILSIISPFKLSLSNILQSTIYINWRGAYFLRNSNFLNST